VNCALASRPASPASASNSSPISTPWAHGWSKQIRAAAPKRTGALAASVRHEVVKTPEGVRLKLIVGNDTVYYAPFVEFGTAREPVHAFVRPVVYREEQQIPGRIEHTLSTSWDAE
jgi:HK97 gp10 family phage protein